MEVRIISFGHSAWNCLNFAGAAHGAEAAENHGRVAEVRHFWVRCKLDYFLRAQIFSKDH
jgi:hypothetical protein